MHALCPLLLIDRQQCLSSVAGFTKMSVDTGIMTELRRRSTIKAQRFNKVTGENQETGLIPVLWEGSDYSTPSLTVIHS